MTDDYTMELRDGSDLEKPAELEAAIDRAEDLKIKLMKKRITNTAVKASFLCIKKK